MTPDPGTIRAGIGLVQVLHRLALGVEPIDAFTRGPIGLGVRVGREVAGGPRRFRAGSGPLDPLARRVDAALETNGTARFKLRHGAGLEQAQSVVVRLHDPWRRYVSRRFDLPIWTFAEVTASEEQPFDGPAPHGPFIPAASRLLRPWLLPGSAYAAPRGTTGLRGRLARDGQPVPWPRVEALGPGDVIVGRAHGDERGEFLVFVTETETLVPPLSTLDIRLVLYGPPPAAAGDGSGPGALPADDPLAGLPLEPVTRSQSPPVPGDLDNPLLRGQTVPATYLRQSLQQPLEIEIGRVRAISQPFQFDP